MKKLGLMMAATMAATMMGAAAHASTTIHNNGDGTFTDSATGLRWQDVSTFYNSTYSHDESLLLSGFSFADQAQMSQLQLDTGINPTTDSATFVAVATAMGAAQPTPAGRELIWGLYANGTKQAYSYGPATSKPKWSDNNANGRAYSDLGAFAVSDVVSAAPEPSVWALMLAGVAMIGLTLRQGRRQRGTAIA